MAYVTIKHGDTVLGELNDGDGLKLNTRGTAIDPSTGEYVGLFIREDIEIDVNYPVQYDYSTYHPTLCFIANTDGSTIAMEVYGTPRGSDIKFSTNGMDWNTFIPGNTTITLSHVGNRVYFKGNNPYGFSKDYDNFYKFKTTGSISISGNIMGLLDNGICSLYYIPDQYCFYRLFEGNTSILRASLSLPATTLASHCYYNMFAGCSTMIEAPSVLLASSLTPYCYYAMFLGCSSLTTPPAIRAYTLDTLCCYQMFAGCDSLTSVPALHAQFFNDPSYSYMFAGCTSLIVSDTSGEGYIYQWLIPLNGVGKGGDYLMNYMFSGCSGIRSEGNSPSFYNRVKVYYTQNLPIY